MQIVTDAGRARPHAFDLAGKVAVESNGDGLATEVADEDTRLVGKGVDDGLEIGWRIDRCAEITPRALHDVVKVRQQFAAA